MMQTLRQEDDPASSQLNLYMVDGNLLMAGSVKFAHSK